MTPSNESHLREIPEGAKLEILLMKLVSEVCNANEDFEKVEAVKRKIICLFQEKETKCEEKISELSRKANSAANLYRDKYLSLKSSIDSALINLKVILETR